MEIAACVISITSRMEMMEPSDTERKKKSFETGHNLQVVVNGFFSEMMHLCSSQGDARICVLALSVARRVLACQSWRIRDQESLPRVCIK